MANYKYKAFISYSHHDVIVARWLHRALEAYRPPRDIESHASSSAQISAFPLRPIFRDEDELVVSANLSDSLVEALQQSEFLIVICSPSSVSSKWASQEIIEFKKNRGASNVIAVIADGDPENCFPEPLLREVLPSGELGASSMEPLAADLQGGRTARRLALLKVAASMMGVGLDQLVQREAQRRNRFLALVTTAAVIGMLVMGWLTFTAVTERRAADEARAVAERSEQMAEQRREEAEGLIEFMLTDLRDKLEPVGRLDVLDAVGVKALDYYGQQDEQRLEPESLGRRARALHLLGEISNLRGDVDAAAKRFMLAAETTKQQLELAPEDPERIFDHAQSVFWIGLLDYYEGRYSEARSWFEQYLEFGKQLVVIDDQDPKWLMELFYGYHNMGGLSVSQERWQEAVTHFEEALDVLMELKRLGEPYEESLVELHSWLRSAYLPQLEFDKANFHNQQEILGYSALIDADPGNARNELALVVAYRGAATQALIRNDIQGALGFLMPLESRLAQLNEVEPEDTSVIEQQAILLRQMAEVRLLNEEWALSWELAKACQKIAGSLLQLNDSNVFWLTGINWPCQYLTAQASFRQGRTDQALTQLESYYPGLQDEYRSNPDLIDLDRVLGESSVLLGDIAQAQGQPARAIEHWQYASRVLDRDITTVRPRTLVMQIVALSRLDEKAEAQELIDYLNAASFQHPAFLEVANSLR